jgi:AraC-like DNA-binding protein
MDPSAVFRDRLDRLFAGAGLGAVTRAVEAGHTGMPPDASLMEHPRLIVALEGAVVLRPGDALFVAPGRWVRARPRRAYASMGVVFYATATRFYLMRGKPEREAPSPRPVETWIAPLGLGEDARALARLLAGEAPAGGERFFHRAAECLLLAARGLLDAPAEGAPGAAGKARFTWQAACDFVAENLSRPLGRKEVARHLGIHPNHLSRLFAEFSGEAFSAYVQNRRVERARLLLADPKLNMAEVARLSGFASGNYFARVFRRRAGRTPTRARRTG